jgi:nucleoside-diphosphate-sugar epimerase
MVVLVTGGAGFLGSHLVDRLLAGGDDVIVADNLSTGNLRNVESAIESARCTFVFCDVAQPAGQLKSELAAGLRHRRIDRIYHLASPASPDAYGAHPWETLAVNGLGTMSLIDLALEHDARFLYTSTSEIYGDPLEHPQRESYFGNVDPIGERACYDEGKRFGEAAVSVAVRSRSLDGRIVRFFNCYGPRLSAADGRLIPSLYEALVAKRPLPIHGTGMQTRSMTYVDDAIDLLWRVMEGPAPDALQPINIGNDDERTVLEIAEAFALAAGIPFEFEMQAARPSDPQRRKPDLTLARRYAWSPTTSLHDGLRATLAWLSEASANYV